MMRFEDLLYPLSAHRFYDHYVNQIPLFIRGGPAARGLNLLTSRHVDDLLAQGQHPSDRFIMTIDDGRKIPQEYYWTPETPPRIDASAVQRLLDGGASLIINGIDEVVPEVGDLVQAIEWELAANVWANAYVTFEKGGALKVHYDDHDVIVLQVSGAKRWYLFGRTEEFPVKPALPDAHPPSEIVHNEVLGPGEVTFVPRGVWHRTEVVESPSIHLTISVGGATGLEWARDAIEQLAEVALFRRYFPRVAGPDAMREHERQMKDRLHRWVDDLSLSAFINRRDARRRGRSRSILWGDRAPCATTQLRLALRRLPEWRESDAAGAALPNSPKQAEDLSPLARSAFQIMCSRRVVAFATLVDELQSQDGTPDSDHISKAVIELLESGLIIY